MESATNGVSHQGPVPRGRIKGEKDPAKRGKSRVVSDDPKLERKRAKAREYYYRTRDRQLATKRAKHAEKGKALRVIPQEDDGKPTVPKRPGKVDALICINRSLLFLHQGDTDGAELWSRFAARIIEGKE
jgi:hypothetical protein